MAQKVKAQAYVRKSEQLTDSIYSIWLEQSEIVANAKPGQFVAVYCNNQTHLLPRPISICELDQQNGTMRLVFRVVGDGTKELALLKEGDSIEIMGPLGNGFTFEGKKAILIGGGIGIPPMLELSKQLGIEKSIVLGYRDQETFLSKEFEEYGNVYIATEDGSVGTKGNVIDAINANNIDADIIFACGPTPMLRGIKEYASAHGIIAQISMEERMACGIGACLACVCKSKEVDEHSHVNNKRVCKDGPVFYAEEVTL